MQDHNSLAQGAPTISLALQALGPKGTFKLCAELIQPTSPLLTYLLTTYVQLILGAYMETLQGPPGTGKSTVIALKVLFKMIGLPADTECIHHSTQNAATTALNALIYEFTGEAPVNGQITRVLGHHASGRETITPLDGNAQIAS